MTSCVVYAEEFSSQPLPLNMKNQLMKTGDWGPKCPVPLDRFSLLTVSYYDFNNKEKVGKIIVFDGLANLTLEAFKKMYNMHYPLETVTIENPPTDEETSGFVCRDIVGGDDYSQHAYGLAMDVNVSRNPYIGAFRVKENGDVYGSLIPPSMTSYAYLNRKIERPGMNEKIIDVMRQAGFTRWGGSWEDRVDYQHFEVPKNIGLNVIYLDKETAEAFIKLTILYPDSAKRMSNDSRWQYLYLLYPQKYLEALTDFFPLLSTEDETTVIHQIYTKLSSS